MKQKRTKLKVKPRKDGRPTMYRAHYADQARKLCLLGYTDKELADFFGIAESNLNVWKLKHPTFQESIKAGKAIVDADVAASLLHRAMGYSHTATKILMSDGDPIHEQYIERFPPDPTSAIFWLKNRQPARWRDTNRTELTGKDGGPLTVKHSPEDIAAAAALAKELLNVPA